MYSASGMHPSDCDNTHPEPTEEEMIAIHEEEDAFWQEVDSIKQELELAKATRSQEDVTRLETKSYELMQDWFGDDGLGY